MESKHTQGEWKVERIYKNPFSIDTLYIINTGVPQSIKESEANAKLIAAAPELLEALIEVRQHMTAHIPEKIFDLIDNAIDKATK